MNGQPTQSFTRVAVAIVVAGVVIGAGIFASSAFSRPKTTTATDVTTTVLSTADCTVSSTVTMSPCTITTTQTVTETSNVYNLVFRQTTPCPNIGYFAPWSVTLSNGQSVTAEDANSTQCCGGSTINPSIIALLVPSGNYSYSTTPPNRFTPGTGTVTVDNQEVVVNLEVFMASCGSTTTG